MKKYKTEDLYLIKLYAETRRYDEFRRDMMVLYVPVERRFIMCKTDEKDFFKTYYLFERGFYLDCHFSNSEFGFSAMREAKNPIKLNEVIDNLPKKLNEKQILELQNKINYQNLLGADKDIDAHH